MSTGEEFATLASRYCTTVDEAAERDRYALILEMRLLLADLYAAGTRLPVREPIDGVQSLRSSHEEWQQRFEMLGGVLGHWDSYRAVLDPYGEDAADRRSVADDLADIWRDLREGLDLLESGAPLEAAIIEWQLSFEIHWGEHALGALRALYFLVEREASGRPSPQASGSETTQS